jgi:hypothetical protein
MSASVFARALSVAALVGSLAFQPAAHAILIGDFSWSTHGEGECDANLCGSVFTVGNFSDLTLAELGGSFFDVFVDLETGTGLRTLSLGTIDVGTSVQSIDDLLGLEIFSAALRLTFTIATLPGSVQLVDFEDSVVAGLTAPGTAALIDYRVDDVVSVPEPSTLLLLAGGLMGMALRRRAGRRHQENQG